MFFFSLKVAQFKKKEDLKKRTEKNLMGEIKKKLTNKRQKCFGIEKKKNQKRDIKDKER